MTTLIPVALPYSNEYRGFTIKACVDVGTSVIEALPTTPPEAVFWTVYGTYPDDNRMALGDFKSLAGARNAVDVMHHTVVPISPTDLMEAACCIWEYVIDHGGYQTVWPDLGECGVCEARSVASALAEYAHRGWLLAQSLGFDAPFDWEFIPWFVENCSTSDGNPMDDREALIRRKNWRA